MWNPQQRRLLVCRFNREDNFLMRGLDGLRPKIVFYSTLAPPLPKKKVEHDYRIRYWRVSLRDDVVW